jgi:hypothetical protein
MNACASFRRRWHRRVGRGRDGSDTGRSRGFGFVEMATAEAG